MKHYISEKLRITPDIIHGEDSAAATNINSRQKRINAFQSTEGFNVIILSPTAVGFGVNIQQANHVIHYMRTWNPAKEDQATDRAYRIGQKNNVYVYYPTVVSKEFATLDKRIDTIIELKRSLAGDVLNGSPDILFSDIRIDEVVPGEFGQELDEIITIEHAERMEWRTFEGLAAAIWQKKGYNTVYCTPPSSDNGVDVVAINGNQGVLIQTKTSISDGYRNGWDAVKEVLGGRAFYQSRHPNVSFKLVGMTNQYFNDHAQSNADLNNVELINKEELGCILESCHIRMSDIDSLLYTSN